MTVEHDSISNTEVHSPKGFDAASNDSVLTKDSAGAVEWVPKGTLIESVSATGDLTIGHTVNNATATTATALDTYYPLAGTWTEHHTDNMSTVAATGRFIIDTNFDGDYSIEAIISMIASRGSDVVCFSFIKNGSYVAGTPRIRRKIGTGADVGALSVATTFHGLVATDYIQCAVQLITGDGANTAGDTVTIENAVITMAKVS